MSRLTKDQINQYKELILNGISEEDYDGKELKTYKEKIQFVYDCFYQEAFEWQLQKNQYDVFKNWLMGLPSALSIPFYNSEILELAERINKVEYKTESQQYKILENYWLFMTNIFFKLVKQHKIETL